MYLIDANNVMGKSREWQEDQDTARQKFLHELAQLGRVKKIRLTAIFDGAADPRFADGASFRGIRILYARPGSDADSRIIEIVERERNRKALTVVTSDYALAGYVRSCGVRVLRAQQLRQMMREAAATSSLSDSAQKVQPEEIADWMRYFGTEEEEEDD